MFLYSFLILVFFLKLSRVKNRWRVTSLGVSKKVFMTRAL